jgi:hypothetical protein
MARRRNARVVHRTIGAAVVYLLLASAAAAIQLDEEGEIKLGVRTYTGARIGTEQTDIKIVQDDEDNPTRVISRTMGVFPVSTAASLRQHRVFAEVNLNHDLTRLVREGWGPFTLLNHLPFKIRKLEYYLAYRFEYEGVYDYGPAEFRTAQQWRDPLLVPEGVFCGIGGICRDDIIGPGRERLRDVGGVRNRLFQAYLQTKIGKVTLRFGRQILAWGETDVFRLLDNINPLDASFGGFLISLDERRVPLDMLRATWYLGDFRHTGIPGLDVLSKLPFYEAYLEGFIAIDNKTGFSPGIPQGSAWGLPNISAPSTGTYTTRFSPSRTFADARGGFQFRFSTPFPGIGEMMLGGAHYFTYLDTPLVTILTQNFPLYITEDVGARGYPSWAQQRAPRVRISGLFGNFAIPPKWVRPLYISGEPIIRFELAYFRNEPRQTQANLDPFYFALPPPGEANCARGQLVDSSGHRTEDGPYCSGGGRTGDSWNFALGLDLNQWIRYLNPKATYFISTQFFYKHLRGAVDRRPVETPFPQFPGQPPVYHGEVQPVPAQSLAPDGYGFATDAVIPDFIHIPKDQYTNTLLIATPYYSGQILPSFGAIYDWGGALTLQPGVTFSRDPFRLTVSYSYISAGRLKGGSGVSLLRDRDNLLIQLEYVI